jgi:hypothetical protein
MPKTLMGQFDSQHEQRYLSLRHSVQIASDQVSLFLSGYSGLFPLGQNGLSLKWTIHYHVVSKIRTLSFASTPIS